MDVLWSPWRSKYIGTFKESASKQAEECFFCAAVQDDKNDKERLVVHRGKNTIALLNKYPYNNGHVLIAPKRHIGDICLLTDAELIEIQMTVKNTVSLLDVLYAPHGFNVGVNIGRAAGAGVPGHIHWHVIPRWNGDTSFMATALDTNVVSVALDDTWRELKVLFEEFNAKNSMLAEDNLPNRIAQKQGKT